MVTNHLGKSDKRSKRFSNVDIACGKGRTPVW